MSVKVVLFRVSENRKMGRISRRLATVSGSRFQKSKVLFRDQKCIVLQEDYEGWLPRFRNPENRLLLVL